MKNIFKTLKSRIGNALIPVIGTIMALTILAGSVVAVALNSSKIVYRQNKLEKQNDGRQIIYLAAKYFSSEMNAGRQPGDIRDELQEMFGKGLQITQDTSDREKFYIWYPNSFVDPNQDEYDETRDNSQVKDWLRAVVKKTEADDDNGDHGNSGINETLFKEEAKLDEKYAIGNMMTVYLTDEGLLPGRAYSINEVSLVESDIDNFDEAFTYMNNTGVLETDDILVALYRYGIIKNNNVSYTTIDNENHYEIIYKTGNLGGNYYWQDSKGNDYETKLYRQEYDLDLLYEMVKHEDPGLQVSRSNFKYVYDETTDRHILYSNNPSDNYRVVYNSSQKFAEALTEIIFWKNMTRLSLNLSDVKSVINDAATDFVRNRADLVNQFSYAFDWTYEWKNASLTVFVHWVDRSNKSWYSEADFNDKKIINLYETNTTLKNKYCTSGELDYEKLYNALLTEKKTSYMSANEEAIQAAYEAIIKKEMITRKVSYKDGDDWIIRTVRSQTLFNTYYYYYYWANQGTYNWPSYVINTKPQALQNAVRDFLLKRLNIKYITGEEGKDPVDLGGYEVIDISSDGLKDFQYESYGTNGFKLKYRFGAHVQKSPTQIDYEAPLSDDTGDTFYFTANGVYMGTEKIISYSAKSGYEVFIKTFIEAFASICGVSISDMYTEEEITTKSYEQLKQDLVGPIKYQYLPTSELNSILGKNSTTVPGMKQEAINNKLITYYLQNTKDYEDNQIKEAIQNSNANYTITIKSAKFVDYNSTTFKDCMDYQITFEIKIDGVQNKITRTVSFLIEFMTLSPLNTMKVADGTTYNVPNGNCTPVEDSDGSTKYIFTPKCIYNTNQSVLTKSDIQTGKIPTILTAIPYTERSNSTQVPYGDHKITIDGRDYYITDDINALKNVTSNILYDGDITSLPTDNFTINVYKDKALFINGKLMLSNNQQLKLGQNALLFVNGDMRVDYDVRVSMGKVGNTYYARQLTTSDISSFKSQGVDIHAEKDAKIMINGNFDYRGYKAKVAEASSRTGIRIWNDPTNSRLDRVFEQYVLSTGFIQKENGQKACEKNNADRWEHYPYECRGLLEGIFIINGDMVFHAWDEQNAQSNEDYQVYSMYRNMYSNPLINGTFYVDGSFDMRGLYTSGLYDQCRANFVFAKSIIEPAIALNTILCAGENTQYGAWDETDGYLFMICEEAIDFSKVNFACINLFTPFQELVNAINANKESETNFSDFVKRDEFLTMYPNKAVIDEWGLPSILRSGLAEIYDPGDIGAITVQDEVTGDDV